MTEAEASAPESITHPSGKEVSTSIEVSQDLEEKPVAVEEDDEDETCGFCKFMKAGGCRESFTKWMECVDSEKAKGNDFVETCISQIQDLRECMLANADYYRPMLDEEEDLLQESETADDEDIPEEPSEDSSLEKSSADTKNGDKSNGKGPRAKVEESESHKEKTSKENPKENSEASTVKSESDKGSPPVKVLGGTSLVETTEAKTASS